MEGERASAALTGGVALLERAIAYLLGSIAVVTPEALARPTPCEHWDLYHLLDHLDDSLSVLHEAVAVGYIASDPPTTTVPGFHATPPATTDPNHHVAPPATTEPDNHVTPLRTTDPNRHVTHPLSANIDLSHDPIHSPALSAEAPDGRAGEEIIRLVRDRAIRLLGVWANTGGAPTVRIDDAPMTAAAVAGAGAIELTVHGWDVARACGQPRPIPPDLADELLDLSVLLVRGQDRLGCFAGPVVPPEKALPGDRLVAFLGRHPS